MRILMQLLGPAIVMVLPLMSQPLVWKDLGDGRLELRDQDKPVVVYNYGPQLKPGAPESKRRCCYFFPVYSPAGVSVLDDFPQDHWHHRGLFWSWPVVEAGGKKYDLWMNMTVKEHAEGVPRTTADTREARLETRNFWQADGKDLVREDVRFTAFPAKDGARELQVDLTWEALAEPVTLRGSQESGKSYGGLSVRFAARQGTVLRADGEVLTKDEDLNPRKWAELEGVYDGKKVVLRVTSDPNNPGAPFQWCLRNYGFIGASFPGRTAAVDSFTLQPGKPLKLSFRVRIADLQ